MTKDLIEMCFRFVGLDKIPQIILYSMKSQGREVGWVGEWREEIGFRDRGKEVRRKGGGREGKEVTEREVNKEEVEEVGEEKVEEEKDMEEEENVEEEEV